VFVVPLPTGQTMAEPAAARKMFFNDDVEIWKTCHRTKPTLSLPHYHINNNNSDDDKLIFFFQMKKSIEKKRYLYRNKNGLL